MKRMDVVSAAFCSFVLLAGCNSASTLKESQATAGAPTAAKESQATTGAPTATLERQMAARLIKDSRKLNEQRFESLSAKWRGQCEDRRQRYTDRENVLYDELERLGYIKYEPTQIDDRFGNTVYPTQYCLLKLTDEGNKIASANNWAFKHSEGSSLAFLDIPVYIMELIEVTGIRGGETSSAAAEFTWQWVPTESGQKLQSISRPTLIGRGAGFFQKYDDGWRLVNIHVGY